ncbi:MAG TPA: hypothetical protein VFW31_02750, partial [Candidatus Angelobacter sp.]|nr:hypothetical protein [Candidatus Angelobacter sp.]
LPKVDGKVSTAKPSCRRLRLCLPKVNGKDERLQLQSGQATDTCNSGANGNLQQLGSRVNEFINIL